MIHFIEAFSSLQGEGKTAGRQRLVLRVGGCNLCCKFCDTKYSWVNYPLSDKEANSAISKEAIAEEVIKSLCSTHSSWMLTGGEPLLYSKQLAKLISEYTPKWVEVETNGTIVPVNLLYKLIDLWIISPKQKEDQENKKNTLPVILKEHKKMKDFIIKFPVTKNFTEKKFVETLGEYTDVYSIPDLREHVWLMPETQGAKFINALEVWEMAQKYNVNYSDRLHVRIYGGERGV